MQMMLAVALGGAVGAVGRYLVVTRLGELLGYGFPYGTLAVNVIGSFLMGCLVEASALALPLSTEARGLILVGGLGAFTTFSTFALDVATFYERGELTGLAIYIAASVAFSILALVLGLKLMRFFLA